MKKNQKQTLQSQRDFFSAFFGEEVCCGEQSATIEELNDAINDCMAMLQYSIDRNDKNEIFYWRKLLQENKVRRREMLTA